MSSITPQSTASTERAPPSGTSTTSLALLSAITSTSTVTSSSSSSTAQTQPQKKKLPWGPILNLLLVLVVIILLVVSIIQTWSHIHTLFSAQGTSFSSTTGPTTAINSSNSSSSSSSSRTIAAATQLGGVDLGLTSSNNTRENIGEAKDSHAVITSRPLVVRAVDIPQSPTAPAHDPSTVTQPKTKPPSPSQPHPHIPQGPHPEQQQPHTPSPEGTGPKRVSKTKLDGIVAHTASTHDHPNHHPHDQTSNPDSDQNNEASPTVSRNTVILTICAALGGLAGCFCCILGGSRLAICCYYRRRGIVASKGGVVCLDGKRIGPPRLPISRSSFGSSSSSASLVTPSSPSLGGQQPQQQVQMTEFWNVDDPKDSKKSPTSSTSSPLSSMGLFKTLRRPSYANITNTSIPVKKKNDAPSRLPLAVTAPTAHVISSPVDFIPPQHSLDPPSTSSTTSPGGGGGLDSYYLPYTGGWNNLDFDPLLSPNPSSTTGSGSGTSTKSRRMPAYSPPPPPLPLSMPMSLKPNSNQHASSPLSSGLISPCTTMTPSTAGSSGNSEMSPFPWSKSAPYNMDDKSHSSFTGKTMAMSRAQKPQPIDTDTASTLTTPATTAMMHTSPMSTRSPFLSSPSGHSLSTTPTVPTPPSPMHFPRHDVSGANATSRTGSGSNFRGPRSPDHSHHNYYHHIQQQPQQQLQPSYQHSQHPSRNNNNHSSHNSPKLHYHQQPFLYNDSNPVYQ